MVNMPPVLISIKEVGPLVMAKVVVEEARDLVLIILKTKVKDDLSKFLYSKTKRKPMILPMIMNV